MASQFNETRYTLSYKNDKGETETIQVAERAKKPIEESIKELEANGATDVQTEKTQTFQLSEATSPSDFAELVPDEEEQVNIFNRGYVIKQQSIIREHMLDANWAAQDGAFDLRAEAAEKQERVKASPESKAKKQLESLDPEALARVLAAYKDVMAQAGASAA